MGVIDDEDIRGAARVMGVEYTEEERAQMLDNLEAQIDQARMRRAITFGNAEPMSLRFDPRPNGWAPRMEPGGQVFTVRDPGPVPRDETDIAFAPLPQLAAWIRRGALSSRRLTDIYLKRIERIAPGLECFVTVLPELARAQADAMDALLAAGTWVGPLHGIPYGAKDLFDTAGIATTWGAMPYRDRVARTDAHVVRHLRHAGAVLIGKTTLGAIAYGDIWFGGTTRNPWNPAEGSSGSSAGSAAAVVAGLCGFALGTETLGSITSPSERCGATGLRPTFGRVGRSGAMALCWSLDKIGPMCRGVEDCAMVLAALNGPDQEDRSSIAAPFHFDAGAGVAGMRVGYVPAAFAAPQVTEVERRALAALRDLPVDLVEVAMPDLPIGSLLPTLFAEAAAAFEELTLGGRDDELVWQADTAWPNTWRKARFLSAVDHVQADRLRYRVMTAFDTIFRDVDAMIGPFGGDMLIATNFTGHPCLQLRAGFVERETRGAAASDGGAPRRFRVPAGVSLWAGLFDEGRLCNLGIALEAALGVADRRPALPA
jgi:Asp-tRNA(Asn)/Glu-tRNA(Gln) amidotransferase A subunit family amidase